MHLVIRPIKLLFFIVGLLLMTSARGQDTLRVTIPDLVFELYPAELEVPVYVDYSGDVAGLQFGLAYDTSLLRLDTVEFTIDGNLPFADYGEPVLGRIRIVYYSQDISTFDFNDDSVAMKLRFSVLDSIKAGFSPIDFTDDIGTIFVDDNAVPIPLIRTGGSVVTGLLSPQLSVGEPVANAATDEVCVSLRPVILPSVVGFDFGLEWDTTAFKLVGVNTLANPLSLQPAEISFSPTSFGLRRLPGTEPPTPTMGAESELMQLCFLGDSSTSYSALEYFSEDTSFVINTVDAGDLVSGGSFTGGYLAYEPGVDEDVRVRLATPDLSEVDPAHCLEVWLDSLPPVNRFSFELGWPDAEVRLADYRTLNDALAFDNYGTVVATDSGLMVSYQLPGDEVSERVERAPLLKFCLEGAPLLRCTGYNVSFRETEATPASFISRYPVLAEDKPLEYAVSDGTTGIPYVDTLRLSLSDTSLVLPENSVFSLILRADTEACLSHFNGTIFLPAQIAELVGVEVLNEDATIAVGFNDNELGAYHYNVNNITDATLTHLLPGELLKLNLRRVMTLDTITALLFAEDYIYYYGLYEVPLTPIKGRNGRVVFQAPLGTHSMNYAYESVALFPNPTLAEVYLGDDDWRGALLTLFNAKGQVVRSNEVFDRGFSLAGLPAGEYLIRLEKDGVFGMARVVKR